MSKVYQMRLLDGSDLSKEWIEVSESEYNTPLRDPSVWEKRILYTAPPIDTSTSIGVGDGAGKLVVHGDYDSIKAVQRIIFENEDLREKCKSSEQMIKDYEEAAADKRRLTREIDVLLNGSGAAQQASLCDIVSQLRSLCVLPSEPTPAMLYAIWAHRQDMRGASENDIATYSYLRLRQHVMGTAQPQGEWERPSKYGFKEGDKDV